MDKVKTLREVPRVPECCGKAMSKMQNASPATGKILTVYSCEHCGKQMKQDDHD
jgi:hypothetical protein